MCDKDCFNCTEPDCTLDGLTQKDRKEIRERDNRYFNSIEVTCAKQMPRRARKKKPVVSWLS